MTLATLFTAVVTILAVLVLFWTMLRVGGMRGKHNILAPATTGHPEFDRAYRVQMNTLENTVMFLPLLWLAAHYGFTGWAGLIGLVWLLGRVWYAVAYLGNAEKRAGGYAVSMVAWFALLLLACVGVVRAMMLG
jgi:hypothetical protein